VTYCVIQGRYAYTFRAINVAGQMVDAHLSGRCHGATAQATFERAVAVTESTEVRVTTDKVKCYPPTLRVVLPGAEHRRSKHPNNGLERDNFYL
jgi:transposase-like protein